MKMKKLYYLFFVPLIWALFFPVILQAAAQKPPPELFDLIVVSKYDTPVPHIGLNTYVSGTLVNAYMTEPIIFDDGAIHTCIGWLGEGSVPDSGTTTSLTFHIDEDSTITWQWRNSYKLETMSCPEEGGAVFLYGTEDSPDDFYNEGITVTIFAKPASGFVFDQWIGDSSGSENPLTFTMDSPETITAHFSETLPKNKLFVISDFDTPVPPAGENEFTSGSLVTAYITDPIIDVDVGIRYVCTGFLGEGSVPDACTTTTVTFMIDEASTITWQWQKQYYVNATASPVEGGIIQHDDETPVTGWYDENQEIKIEAVPAEGYLFTNWSGDLTGSENPITFAVDDPKNIVAHFALAHKLIICSEFDEPVPAVGEHLYTSGTLVNAYMTNPIVAGEEGARHICIGFIGEGSVPDMGTTTTLTFVIDEPTTITWQWQKQLYLEATSNPPEGGSVVIDGGEIPATGWYDEGITVTIFAAPAPNYTFDNWSGDISTTDNPIEILMDTPKDIVANFLSTGGIITVYDFVEDEEGWTTGTIPLLFPEPDFGWGPGSLLTGPNALGNFGFWQSPTDAIPTTDGDSLYAVNIALETDIPQCDVPILRLRTNSLNFAQANLLVLNSISTCEYSSSDVEKTYTLYFQPQGEAIGENFLIAIDLLNLDPGDATSGTIKINSVNVIKIPLSMLKNQNLEKQYTFDESTESWLASGQIGDLTAPLFEYTSSSLQMTSLNNTDTFGFWNNTPSDISISANKIYKGVYSLTTSDPLTMGSAIMRARMFSEDNQVVLLFEASMFKLPQPKEEFRESNSTFNAYFVPPQFLVGTDLDGCGLAIDLLNIDPNAPQEFMLSLDELNLETYDIPAYYYTLFDF